MGNILVVDDQKNMRTTLRVILRGAGHDVAEADDAAAAAQQLDADDFDVVLTDLRLGGPDGIEVLKRAREVAPATQVIVMTAFGTVESAVQAMRLGAFDYLEKPFRDEELLTKVDRAMTMRESVAPPAAVAAAAGGGGSSRSVVTGDARGRSRRLEEWTPARGIATGVRYRLIGTSSAMRDVFERVERIAPTDATVLITGESGTGKELVARAIHASSNRADRPFVTVNCAAINETLFESELFGHVKGAFTGAVSTRRGLFEEASGGTFFFDEIAETPPTTQAKLLRALQEGEIRRIGDNRGVEVDVRLIAATNQDLPHAIAEKRFRKDLYYRLNVARFSLPPLRDRPEDIPELVRFFVDRYSNKLGREVALEDGVMDFLVRYDYPGNVRELENMIEQAVALNVDGLIQVDDVRPVEALEVEQPRGAGTVPPGMASSKLQDVVDEVERAHIERTLRDVAGSRDKAAEILGLSPTTLWRKMKRLKVDA